MLWQMELRRLFGEDAEQVIELLAHDAGRVEVLLREELKLNPRLVADRVEVEVSEAHQWIPRIVEAFRPKHFSRSLYESRRLAMRSLN